MPKLKNIKPVLVTPDQALSDCWMRLLEDRPNITSVLGSVGFGCDAFVSLSDALAELAQ
jgi:hypothetical protein